MSRRWNDCIEIYLDGEFNDNFDMNMLGLWQAYISRVGHEPEEKVWYDTKAKCCFGAEQVWYGNPGDFSFFSSREMFKSNPRWGQEHVAKYLGEVLGKNTIETNEYIIQDFEGFKKYEGKTILMIGGGPSTNDIGWNAKDIEYDYAWSCNNFYLREDADKIAISLAALGPVVDLQDPKLHEYIEKHKTTCVFEGGISPFRKPLDLSTFKNLWPEQTAYFHLRYFSKLGTLARLVCFATFLKVKKIYFIGMDGYPGKDGSKYEHAFEGAEKDHGGRLFSYDLHRRQYTLLWDYLLNSLNSKVEYQNLGEGHSANQSSDISKQEFPLQS